MIPCKTIGRPLVSSITPPPPIIFLILTYFESSNRSVVIFWVPQPYHSIFSGVVVHLNMGVHGRLQVFTCGLSPIVIGHFNF